MMTTNALVENRHRSEAFTMARLEVPEVDGLNVLADGGCSNAQAAAQCERDNVEVAAPIRRGTMSTEFFRPVRVR